jgi:hypothetical protein
MFSIFVLNNKHNNVNMKTKTVKKSPSNNKEQVNEPKMALVKDEHQQPQPEPKQPQPEFFTVSIEGTDELVKALNETISSKYVKQVIFNVVNEYFKPVFPK